MLLALHAALISVINVCIYTKQTNVHGNTRKIDLWERYDEFQEEKSR